MTERLPALLTVEEAASLLRIGRTKAYAMAKQWRATGGRAGLPVVDLGDVLRVPLRALEQLIGAELHEWAAEPTPPRATASEAEPVEGRTTATRPTAAGSATASARTANLTTPRRQRERKRSSSQLDLFALRKPAS